MSDEKKFSDEEYRDWLIGCLHRFGHDELIAIVCEMGEDKLLKDVLDTMNMQQYDHIAEIN